MIWRDRLIGLFGLAAGACGALVPQPARADWLRAESERFIVYSDGGERPLRQYVQKLETFDRVMRYRSGFPITQAPPRKLPIYLVGSRAGLLRVYPEAQANVVGTYFPAEEDIFAVAMRGENDEILLHEYAHHFMLGNLAAAYPGWLVEGFAEYYQTADIDGARVQIGLFSENRAYWLTHATWLPLDVLLKSRPAEVTRSSYRQTYYPVAWLLTHWFFSEPARLQQLSVYLQAVAAGGDPVDSIQTATGMSLEQLRAALRRYMGQRLMAATLTGDAFTPVDITVTHMPRSANDLLLLGQRMKIGVADEDRAPLGQEVLRLAERYPDDPLALLVAGHAGLHFDDKPAGERALARLLEIEPNNVEALQLLAEDRLAQADAADEDAVSTALTHEARGYLARAYAAEPNAYRTLMLLSDLRRHARNYPTDNDILTLGLAFDRAPQLPGVRINYAMGLAETDKKDEAIAVLRPLANSPHGGGASEAAEQMIAALESGGEIHVPSDADLNAVPPPPEPEPPDSEPPGSEPEGPPPGDVGDAAGK